MNGPVEGHLGDRRAPLEREGNELEHVVGNRTPIVGSVGGTGSMGAYRQDRPCQQGCRLLSSPPRETCPPTRCLNVRVPWCKFSRLLGRLCPSGSQRNGHPCRHGRSYLLVNYSQLLQHFRQWVSCCWQRAQWVSCCLQRAQAHSLLARAELAGLTAYPPPQLTGLSSILQMLDADYMLARGPPLLD